jgi:hypothetical protein
MPRWTHHLAATLVLAGATGLAGCNHVMLPRNTAVRSTRQATYAISVSLAGGLQPTASQWAAVQSTFARLLAREGIVLVSDLGLADRILRIEFTPDPNDPENLGQATILSIRANPQAGTSSAPAPLLADDLSFPSPFAWGWGGFPLFPGYGGYFGHASYYGYGNAYYDGYSFSAPTLNPRRPHHDGTRAHCAPRRHDAPGEPERRHRPEPPEGKRPPLLAANSPTTVPAALIVYPSPDRTSSMFQDDIRLNRPHRSLADAAESRGQSTRSRPERGGADGESSRSWLGRTLAAADAGAAAASSGQRPASRYEGGNGSGERSWSRQESSAGRTEYQHRGESPPRSQGSSGSSYSSTSGFGSSSNTSSSSSYSSSSSSGSSSYSGASSSSYSSSSASSSSASSGGSSSGSSSSAGSAGSNRVER